MSEAIAHDQNHEHDHSKTYMKVFVILAVMTAVEVGVTMVPFIKNNPALMVIILLVLAMTKAALVALYFMHLKYDNKVLTVIAGVPFLLITFAIAVVAYEGTHDERRLPPLKDKPAGEAPAEGHK